MLNIFGSDTKLEVGKVYVVAELVNLSQQVYFNVPVLILAESNYEEYIKQEDLNCPLKQGEVQYFYKIHTD